MVPCISSLQPALPPPRRPSRAARAASPPAPLPKAAGACAPERAEKALWGGAPLTMLVAGAAAASLCIAPEMALADDAAGQFQRSCVGCHSGGGNVVNPAKTLKQSDLERYGAVDPKVLYDIIYGGQGKMPGYGEECAPKGACTFGARLPDEDIAGLAAYVLSQASAGWPE